MNEKDTLKLMEQVVNKTLPNVLNQAFKNFKTGVISSVSNSIYADVSVDNGTKLSGLKLPKGINANIGDKCVIISINNNNSGSNYIVAVY